MQNRNYGERIKALRNYLGLSLDAFGKAVGYSGTHISRFEKNITEISPQLLKKVCLVYRVNPAFFNCEMHVEDAIEAVPDETKKKDAGIRLREVRIEKGFTQKELSVLSGMTDAQICRIELGESALSEKAAQMLAEALEIGIDWLLYGNEEKKDNPISQKLIDWLWDHPEIRKDLYLSMKETK